MNLDEALASETVAQPKRKPGRPRKIIQPKIEETEPGGGSYDATEDLEDAEEQSFDDIVSTGGGNEPEVTEPEVPGRPISRFSALSKDDGPYQTAFTPETSSDPRVEDLARKYKEIERTNGELVAAVNQLTDIVNRAMPFVMKAMGNGGGDGGGSPVEAAPQVTSDESEQGEEWRPPMIGSAFRQAQSAVSYGGGNPGNGSGSAAPSSPASGGSSLPAVVHQPTNPFAGGGAGSLSTITTLIQIAKDLGILGSKPQPEQGFQGMQSFLDGLKVFAAAFNEVRNVVFAELGQSSMLAARMTKAFGREAITGSPAQAQQSAKEEIGGFAVGTSKK